MRLRAERSDDLWERGFSLVWSAYAHVMQGQIGPALESGQQALAIFEKLNNSFGTSVASGLILGSIAMAMGDIAAAKNYFLRGVQGPVGDGDKFFGRRMLLERLQGSLRTDGGFVMHGLPRSGKSSMLWQLARSGTNGRVTAVVDLQSCMVDDSPDLYLRTLRAIRDAFLANSRLTPADWAAETAGNALVSFTPATPLGEFIDAFEAGIKLLVASLRRRVDRFERFDLLLDDLGSLKPSTTQTFLTQLVNLKQQGSLALGVSGPAFSFQQELSESSLQNLSPSFAAGFEDDECIGMIRSIGHCMYAYFDDDAVAEIIRASGGHPFLVRTLCSIALETKHVLYGKTESAIVGGQAVKQAVESAMGMKSVRQWLERMLHEVDRHLPSGKRLLEAVAQAQGATADRRSRLSNVDYGSASVDSNLKTFRDYGLVPPRESALELRIGLLKRWLQQREAEA